MTIAAEFAHPHWAVVWPAYAIAGLAFIGLVAFAVGRLVVWARAAKREEGAPPP